MVPEGLEWASADEILNDIAGVGFNYIRMCVGVLNIRNLLMRVTGATLSK